MKQFNIKDYKGIYKTSKEETYNDSNFATKEDSPFVGDSYAENEYTPVNPRSLYKAQLAERFTGNINNARSNAPVLVYPRSEKKTDDKNVSVTGVYQLGAEKVTVYIDNIPYDAVLNSDNNSFEVVKELEEGVHKIYATQTINGVEDCKTADRFIIVGKENGNPDYLQSIYSPQQSRMIINDTRPTYDAVEYGNKDKITVMVNGTELISDVEPYETDGRVLVPKRTIFEALIAEVLWDEKNVLLLQQREIL